MSVIARRAAWALGLMAWLLALGGCGDGHERGPVTLVFKYARILGNADPLPELLREFEAAGVAGIHIEDQVWPKRCGHMFGKKLIPAEEMVQKIRSALDARRDKRVPLYSTEVSPSGVPAAHPFTLHANAAAAQALDVGLEGVSLGVLAAQLELVEINLPNLK